MQRWRRLLSVSLVLVVCAQCVYAVGAADGGSITNNAGVLFNFAATVAVGSTVDFVVGNNGSRHRCTERRISICETSQAVLCVHGIVCRFWNNKKR